MQCSRCEYEGRPEFGSFRDMELLALVHIRCPECHNATGIFMPEDTIEEFILYPETCRGRIANREHREVKKTLCFEVGNKTVAYSIYCPICGYGTGSGVKPADFQRLAALQRTVALAQSIEWLNPQIQLLRENQP